MGAGAIGIVGGLVGTGMDMFGKYQQGKAAKTAAKYNDQLAQIEARNVENETAEGIRRERISQRENLAKMRVQAANSGTATTTGNALALISDAAGRMEIGVADAARRANMQSASIRDRGRMGIYEADQFNKGQRLSMLGGAAKAGVSTYSKIQSGRYYGAF